MRALFRTLIGLAIAALGLAGAAAQTLRRERSGPDIQPNQGSRMKLILKTVIATVAAGLILLGVGGFAFMYSGVYDIAANEPHNPIVQWALETASDRSVIFHARRIQAPDIQDPALVRQGLIRYREHCLPCHGAPGVAREALGRGILPDPPPLMTVAGRWTDPQLYWILTNGLKMSGMPALGMQLNEADRWSVVAFVRRMEWLSPAEYREFVAALEAEPTAAPVQWVLEDDQGLTKLEAEGNPERGRQLMRTLGCVACHAIPGRAEATVGPPLTRFVERQFIAGSSANTPKNLQAWILDPERLEPGTAMPNVGATPEQALHLAAYLYTLGDPQRVQRLRRKPARNGGEPVGRSLP
ncbi:MAG: c-type cytochrome [Bryobacteraceae bacterium]|nr:c-type cytochrome [Bryobacteraceae bacterium]